MYSDVMEYPYTLNTLGRLFFTLVVKTTAERLENFTILSNFYDSTQYSENIKCP